MIFDTWYTLDPGADECVLRYRIPDPRQQEGEPAAEDGRPAGLQPGRRLRSMLKPAASGAKDAKDKNRPSESQSASPGAQAADPGADPAGEQPVASAGRRASVSIRSLAGEDASGQIWLGEDAMKRLYETPRNYKVWHPFDQERPGRESSALIGLLLRQAGAFDRFLSPCLEIRTRQDITQEEKELWKKTGLEAGARKVRFVPRLYGEGTQMVIQTGYAGTELGLYVGGVLVKSQYILFGGRTMDEDVQQLVARRTRCLLHLEDARALRISASQALWKGKNPGLEVSGMNRYGEYETVRLKAAAIWPGMKPAIDQIVSWTGSLLEGATMEARELFMKEGLTLRGSLSDCFGLPQTLVQTLGYPVRREDEDA